MGLFVVYGRTIPCEVEEGTMGIKMGIMEFSVRICKMVMG